MTWDFIRSNNCGEKNALSRRTWGCWSMRSSTWAGNVCWQKASCDLVCIQSSVASRAREGILPLHSTLLTAHLESCIQLWSPQHKKDVDVLEWGQRTPRRWSEGWSTTAIRTGWGSWGCSAWRREGCGVSLEQLPVPEGATGRMERGFAQWCVVIGQEGTALS